MDANDRRFTRLLQEAADLLCCNLPDKLVVGLDEDQVWYQYETWSVSLTRYCFAREMPLHEADGLLGPEFAGLPWEDVVFPMVKELFQDDLALQPGRHASAAALGLVRGDGYSNLPVNHMLMDRIALSMLSQSKADLCSVAEAVARTHYMVTGPIKVKGFENRFYVSHSGIGLPVLSTWLPIGNALYDGNLVLPYELPDTMMVAACGRRVGDLISTGITGIDDRHIVSIELAEADLVNHPWPYVTGTQIAIEPDLVPFGTACARPETGL